MIAIFQSVGIVFSLLVLVLVTVATMYLGYVVAIAFIIGALFYITYSLVTLVSSSHTKSN